MSSGMSGPKRHCESLVLPSVFAASSSPGVAFDRSVSPCRRIDALF